MTDRRVAAIEDMGALIDAVDDLLRRLGAARGNYRLAMDTLSTSTPVGEALAGADAAVTRQALTDSLDRFEHHRHASRLSLIAVALDEGSSINTISRTWGISRQLASRYVKEIRNPG